MCVHLWWSCLCSACVHKLSSNFQMLIVVIRSLFTGQNESDYTLNAYWTSGCEDHKFRCPQSHCTNRCSTSCLKHNNTEVKLQNQIFYFCKFALLQPALGWLLFFQFFIENKKKTLFCSTILAHETILHTTDYNKPQILKLECYEAQKACNKSYIYEAHHIQFVLRGADSALWSFWRLQRANMSDCIKLQWRLFAMCLSTIINVSEGGQTVTNAEFLESRLLLIMPNPSQWTSLKVSKSYQF